MPLLRLVSAVVFALLMVPPAIGHAQNDPTASSSKQEPVQALQDYMTSDPAIMDTINDLQSDREFQNVLDDPDIAAALESGDTAALLANPKIGALVNHPKVREITKQLAPRQ